MATSYQNLRDLDETHPYRRGKPSASRSPCPALNTLANHGYVSREGTDLTFTEVSSALVLVYNLSYPLAFLLTIAAFITSAKISFRNKPSNTLRDRVSTTSSRLSLAAYLLLTLLSAPKSLIPRISLDLASLSHRGRFKIAHDASFVHPNGRESSMPDPKLVSSLLEFASSTHNLQGQQRGGLGLPDIARYHAIRARLTPAPLDSLHMQVTLGECALTWLVLRGQESSAEHKQQGPEQHSSNQRLDSVVPIPRLEQWFGEERLPDGWWGVRPVKPVGVIRARGTANLVGRLADIQRREPCAPSDGE